MQGGKAEVGRERRATRKRSDVYLNKQMAMFCWEDSEKLKAVLSTVEKTQKRLSV